MNLPRVLLWIGDIARKRPQKSKPFLQVDITMQWYVVFLIHPVPKQSYWMHRFGCVTSDTTFATCLLRLPLCQDLGFHCQRSHKTHLFSGAAMVGMVELEAFFSPFLKPLGLIVVSVGRWLEPFLSLDLL